MSPSEQAIREFIEISASLAAAVSKAGGGPLSIDQLQKMSGVDLLILLAPNGVRFTNVGAVEHSV